MSRGRLFKVELQAAWRVCLPLANSPSLARRDAFGVLPAFIEELSASTGDRSRLSPFVELLARADCPVDVEFVASVPGRYPRQDLRRAPWGSAGLRRATPAGSGVASVSIATPFVGTWNRSSLGAWCESFAGRPERMSLVWIEKDHPWARARRWILPTNTLEALEASGASVLRLPFDYDESTEGKFHADHRHTDPRWSHAKLYFFKRGRRTRLLVTSANFSTSAWGAVEKDGSLSVTNFELGVSIETDAWPFGELEGFDDSADIYVKDVAAHRTSAAISWAAAAWDGRVVRVEARANGDSDCAPACEGA